MTNSAMTTNELPTPRTDGKCYSPRDCIFEDELNGKVVDADFARQLERETLTLSADCAAMREACRKIIPNLKYCIRWDEDDERWDDPGHAANEALDAIISALSTTAGAELLARLERAETQIENAKAAFGEHPDTDIDLAQRISELRDEARGEFHQHTRNVELLRRAEMAEKERDKALNKSIADRCFDYYGAEDELFERLQVIMGGKPVEQCLEEGFVWMVRDSWTDSYDCSVEVILSGDCPPMTREQADAILALGFGQVYESQGERGYLWYKVGGGSCHPKKPRDERGKDLKREAQRDAAIERVKELENRVKELEEQIREGK